MFQVVRDGLGAISIFKPVDRSLYFGYPLLILVDDAL